jgi:AraC-like DNA-binding protein
MDTLLTLADIHPRDRVAYWHDLACKTIIKHDCRVTSPSKLNATIEGVQLGELGFVKLESRGLDRIERTARNIAHGDDDIFLLSVQLRGGATLSQDGRMTTLRPGDFALLDAQRPYVCRYPYRRQVMIRIPHRALKTRLAASSEVTTRAVRRGNGLGGLTSSYIAMIADRLDTLQPVTRAQIAEHVLDLIALSLAGAMGKDRPKISSGGALNLLQLRTAIESRLIDPAFDPRAAAAAAGISVRYANSLLSQQGTSLERLIISRRLEHCRRAFEDPGQAQRTITDIAFGWGFSNLSHFNRRFKAEHGCSPRDYRRRFQA